MDRASSDDDQAAPGGAGRTATAAETAGPTPLTEPHPTSGERLDGARLDRSSAEPAPVSVEPRQRWRITYGRDELPPDRIGRRLLDDWHEAVRLSMLAVATHDGDPNRPRLAFAAPLPAAARGVAELVDLWLLERVPLWRLREGLADRLPAGHRWVSAEDVWLGAPPLPGQVSAAVWRAEIGAVGAAIARLDEAAAALLASRSLPRVKDKGGVTRSYDLRPLIADVSIEQGHPPGLRIVTRFDPTLGSGRPEELVAALSEKAGIPLEIRAMIRERLLLNTPTTAAKSPSSPGVKPRRLSR